MGQFCSFSLCRSSHGGFNTDGCSTGRGSRGEVLVDAGSPTTSPPPAWASSILNIESGARLHKLEDDRGQHPTAVNLWHNYRHLGHLGEHQHQQLLPRLLHALPRLHALEQALLPCFLWQSPSVSMHVRIQRPLTG